MSNETWNVEANDGIVAITSLDRKYSCQIYLYGATVTSWIHDGKEKLFVSQTAILNQTKVFQLIKI